MCGGRITLIVLLAPGVQVAGGYRPDLSNVAPPEINAVIEACWNGAAEERPTAAALLATLEGLRTAGEEVFR